MIDLLGKGLGVWAREAAATRWIVIRAPPSHGGLLFPLTGALRPGLFQLSTFVCASFQYGISSTVLAYSGKIGVAYWYR